MRCTAHRRNGEQCRSWAVKGANVCRMHGGSIPAVRAAAARRVEEEKARKRAARLIHTVDVDPTTALLDLVHTTAGEVAYWQARVDALQDQDERRLTNGPTKITEGKDRGGVTTLRVVEAAAAIEYRMLVDAKNRLAKYATDALRAGVEERRVRIAEDLGGQLVGLLRRVIDRLDLTEWQRELADTVVPEELRRLDEAR